MRRLGIHCAQMVLFSFSLVKATASTSRSTLTLAPPDHPREPRRLSTNDIPLAAPPALSTRTSSLTCFVLVNSAGWVSHAGTIASLQWWTTRLKSERFARTDRARRRSSLAASKRARAGEGSLRGPEAYVVEVSGCPHCTGAPSQILARAQ